MIDRQARDEVAQVIEDYLEGRMDSRHLDEFLNQNRVWCNVDRAIGNTAWAMWFFYSDAGPARKNVGEHKIRPKAELMIRRWLLLLKSNVEWPDASPREKVPKASAWSRTLRVLLIPVYLFELLTGLPCSAKPDIPFESNPFWPFHSTEEWDQIPGVRENHNSGRS